MEAKDDIAIFLTGFERHMRNYRVHQDRWMAHLTPILNQTVMEIFGRLPADTQEVYDRVKTCLLRELNITTETYRRRFEALEKNEEASYVPGNWPSRLLVAGLSIQRRQT